MSYVSHTILRVCRGMILVGIPVILYTPISYAETYFETGLLNTGDGAPPVKSLDSALSDRSTPGTYHVHIIVNDEEYEVADVLFKKTGEGSLTPCLGYQQYIRAGVDPDAANVHLPEADDKTCMPFNEAIPDATAVFDFAHMKLTLSIPQVFMSARVQDEVPPALWDSGINAALAEYDLNASQTLHSSDPAQQGAAYFLNLKDGINWGAWRLRDYSTFTSSPDATSEWDNISTYVERSLPSLKSELVVGDTWTSADAFDSLAIRGIQLYSEQDMIPDSLNGFAPVIHGIARSSAKVTVRENNNIIYQTSVAAGPFAITSLSPVSTGGHFDITVTESDGSESHFIQSYASVPGLQRAGQLKYSFSAGRAVTEDTPHITHIGENDSTDSENKMSAPDVAQLNLALGLPYDVTLLSGMQLSTSHYYAGNMGLGTEMGMAGAISADMTQAWSRLQDNQDALRGQSWRVSYANHLEQTNTDLQLSGRHYSRDYRALPDLINGNSTAVDKKQELAFSVNQMLNDSQSLFISLNDIRNQHAHNSRNYQFGFATPLGQASFSLNFSLNDIQNDDEQIRHDRQVSCNVSLPLHHFPLESTENLSFTMNSDLKGMSSEQTGLSGRFAGFETSSWNLQYGLNQNPAQTDSDSLNAVATYKGRNGEVKAGYNHDQSQEQLTYGARGGMVLHRNGLTLSQYASGAMALVSAPGAGNIPLNDGSGISTDWRGYTVIPDISPFARNQIQIDPGRLSPNVTLESISATVIPTKDAVVLAAFTAHAGRKVVATLTKAGKAIPFGSVATLQGENKRYFVGEGGEVYFTSAPETGILQVSFGENGHCTAPFTLTDSPPDRPVTIVSLICS